MPGEVSIRPGQSVNGRNRPTGEPGGGEHHQHGQSDHALGRAILQASGPAEDPDEGRPDDKDEHQSPSDAAKQGPEGGEAVAVVDQGDTESKKNPARYVVADSGSQNGDANTGAEQVQLAENAAEHRKGSDG